MTAFAGIYLRQASQSRLQELVDSLDLAVSAHSAGRELNSYAIPNGAVRHFTNNSFGTPGTSVDELTITVAAGHPYFDNLATSDRQAHVLYLGAMLKPRRFSALAAARGSYCAAHLDERGACLVTDCLGVRPLYYFDSGDYVLFSTNLATFKHFARINLKFDERALIEHSVFGFSTAERTKYAGVHCIYGGSVAHFSEREMKQVCYWDWNEVQPAVVGDRTESAVFESFMSAVKLRLEKDTCATAFLTGGLDSRCVVAALRLLNADVHTLNFAPMHSKDLVYGARIAAALKTFHLELPMPLASVAGKISTVIPKWRQAIGTHQIAPQRPRLVWSGDGGSVALGHVYLTERVVSLMERGSEDEALGELLKEQAWLVPIGIVNQKRVNEIADIPKMGLSEALARIQVRDRGRALHMLLMITDQRRHLHEHYEGIYEHSCELQLPFFDRAFLSLVLSLPVKPFLGHQFYNRWLKQFQGAVSSVPWQVYPGHVPSIVEEVDRLDSQWDSDKNSDSFFYRRRSLCREAFGLLRRRAYLSSLVDYRRLGLAAIATALNMRDYSYALQFAKTASGM